MDREFYVMGIPVAPPGVSLEDNMRMAYTQRNNFNRGGDAFLFSWFYSQVRNRGPWDYKQRGRHYANFGNFHYGAVGRAAGFSLGILLRAAGVAQVLAGTSEEESWLGLLSPPYGDDEVDQYWISEGFEYAKCKGY